MHVMQIHGFPEEVLVWKNHGLRKIKDYWSGLLKKLSHSLKRPLENHICASCSPCLTLHHCLVITERSALLMNKIEKVPYCHTFFLPSISLDSTSLTFSVSGGLPTILGPNTGEHVGILINRKWDKSCLLGHYIPLCYRKLHIYKRK